MVAHTFNSSIWKAEARGIQIPDSLGIQQVQSQPRIHSENLSQPKKKKK